MFFSSLRQFRLSYGWLKGLALDVESQAVRLSRLTAKVRHRFPQRLVHVVAPLTRQPV